MKAVGAEIAREGSITFARFMEIALYHPEGGYYTRGRTGAGPAGPSGDFLTAPTAEPLFARTLAQLLGRLAEKVGRPLCYVELGAGEGVLIDHLIDALGADRGSVVSRWIAVEFGEWARRRIIERCPDVEAVPRLVDATRSVEPVVLVASELYDALPAHRVTVIADAGALVLREFHVAAGNDGRLEWRLEPPSTPALSEYLRERAIVLEEEQVAELRPGLRAFHEEHLRWAGSDAVAVVLDYGYPARQLYNPRARKRGTLVGYRAHEVVEDVLEDPGEIDITAHVNFDDLHDAATGLGWDKGIRQPLGAFLTVHGALDLLPAPVSASRALTAEEWAVLGGSKRLLSPSGMGADLKVLVQGNGRLWQAYRRIATPPPVDA